MKDIPNSFKRNVVDHIPMLWREPAQVQSKDLIIWLPGFSGSKEDTVSQLTAFAEAGFYALSFDPYQHGERSVETREALLARILSNIRRYFWPILTLTAEEFPRVIDHAVDMFGITGKIMVGGISMGGDIAVAAGGVDSRIHAVAACIATPNWLRPGSHEPSGHADIYAQQCYDRRNPLTHLSDYGHRPAISFQSGELDTQVPPSGAEEFIGKLSEQIYQDCLERLELFKQESTPHAFTDEMLQNAIKWFTHHRA